VDDPRKTARALLRHIGAPVGSVNVLVRGPGASPRLVVLLSPSLRIQEERLPRRFGGLDVSYERRQPARPLVRSGAA
jgi:hypothetical protein